MIKNSLIEIAAFSSVAMGLVAASTACTSGPKAVDTKAQQGAVPASNAPTPTVQELIDAKRKSDEQAKSSATLDPGSPYIDTGFAKTNTNIPKMDMNKLSKEALKDFERKRSEKANDPNCESRYTQFRPDGSRYCTQP